MKSKGVRILRWRLRLKLAAAVFLGAAAFLLTPAKPASASSCPNRKCSPNATLLGCCSRFPPRALGSDSSGLCFVPDLDCRCLIRCF